MDIPIELFSLFIGSSIALAIFGFIRNPQVPAMMAFAGIFILFISISTEQITFGQLISSSNISEIQQAIVTVIPSALSRWEFESNAFDSNDGNPLNEQNSPTYSDLNNIPELGEYIILNGTNQFLNATNSNQMNITTEDFSLFGVFRLNGVTPPDIVIAKVDGNNGYYLENTNANALRSSLRVNSVDFQASSGASTIQLNNWYIFLSSYDRNNNLTTYLYNYDSKILYSQSINISSVSGNSISNSVIFTVGQAGGSQFSNIEISELRFYQGIALSQTQFLAIINNGFTDSDIVDGVSIISTETNNYQEDSFVFTELPKTIFALLGVIFMLSGALMVFKENK